jgi:hypothetical protein
MEGRRISSKDWLPSYQSKCLKTPVLENDPASIFDDGPFDVPILVSIEHAIICGRGGEAINNPGNKVFREIVANVQDTYKKIKTKKNKTKIAMKIVEHMYEKGMPFVKKEEAPGDYSEVSKEKAREKTSQALREDYDNERTIDKKGEDQDLYDTIDEILLNDVLLSLR